MPADNAECGCEAQTLDACRSPREMTEGRLGSVGNAEFGSSGWVKNDLLQNPV